MGSRENLDLVAEGNLRLYSPTAHGLVTIATELTPHQRDD